MKSRLIIYIYNFLVSWIPSHLVRRLYLRYFFGVTVDDKASILLGCQFTNGLDFEIGRSVINQRCHIDNRGGIKIGNHVSIGPQVAVITADHDMSTSNIEGRASPVIIEDYVFIGARALILPGVTLKKGSVIAAGAVVVRDVEEFSIVAGGPAKTIGHRRRDLDYTTDYQAWLN